MSFQPQHIKIYLSNQLRFINLSSASNSTIFVLFNLPSKDHHNITKILANIYHYSQHMSFQPQHIKIYLSNQFRFIHTSYASNSTIFVLFNLPSKDHHNITKILSNIYHYSQHMSFQPQHIKIYLSNQLCFINLSSTSNSTIFVLFNLPSKDHHNITKILSNIYHYSQHMSFQP